MAQQIHVQLAQQIVDTLKTICSHDINFIDTQGRICASTDAFRVNSYHAGGHEAAKKGEIITITEDDIIRDMRQGINMPIRFHGATVAVIGITGDPDEVERYANLAQRITLMLLREHEIDVQNYSTRTQTAYFVRALIDREAVTPAFINEVLERNGLSDQGEAWRTIVIYLVENHVSPLSSIESAVHEMTFQQRGCLYTYRYPNTYILIIRDKEMRRWDLLLRTLANSYPSDLKIGIGSPRRLSKQYLSFQAADLAIRSLETGENLARYDACRLEILLSSVSEVAGQAYLEKCLSNLDQSDLDLLRLYFDTDMSLKITAQQCFLHINTLQNRLKRIHERCGLDPRRFRDAAALYAALRFMSIRDRYPAATPVYRSNKPQE